MQGLEDLEQTSQERLEVSVCASSMVCATIGTSNRCDRGGMARSGPPERSPLCVAAVRPYGETRCNENIGDNALLALENAFGWDGSAGSAAPSPCGCRCVSGQAAARGVRGGDAGLPTVWRCDARLYNHECLARAPSGRLWPRHVPAFGRPACLIHDGSLVPTCSAKIRHLKWLDLQN